MNVPVNTPIEQQAQQLRSKEISRLLDAATISVTEWLQERHEGALRRPPRAPRMRSANATPA